MPKVGCDISDATAIHLEEVKQDFSHGDLKVAGKGRSLTMLSRRLATQPPGETGKAFAKGLPYPTASTSTFAPLGWAGA